MNFIYKYFSCLNEGILFNPIWLSAYRLRSQIELAIKQIVFSASDKWLDVGCGLRPYEIYFPNNTYYGVDIMVSGRARSLKAPDYYYDGKKLPFKNNSFEGVISTQVLEHTSDPRHFILEIHRILKPGGRLIISLPFVWQEHEEPYDFYRFTSFGINELLKNNGFKTECIIKDSGAIDTLAMIINVYMIHHFVPNIFGFGHLISLLFCFPIQLLAILLQKVLPDKGQLYLNLVVYAKKLEFSEKSQ